MTPRRIVQKSLAFDKPPRIPLAMLPEFGNDFRRVRRKDAPNRKQQPWTQQPEGHWTMIDEWGNLWRRLENITKGEVHRGVIQDGWDLLDDYEWPETDDPALYEEAAAEVKQYHDEGYYVRAGVWWPFNAARYMRRLEVFLADCAEAPDQVEKLLNRIADMIEAEIYRYADIGVDGIATGEDWGTQDRLLVSPPMFRRLFKPVFKRLCDAAHSRGLDVRLHSCGYVRDVIGDWIEVGVNSLQFDQPELHDIDFLAENFGGKVHFECPVDIQTTLQTQDPAKIEAAAKEYINKLAAPYGGGFVAGYYGSNEALGIDKSVQDVAARAFLKYGDPAPWA